MPVPGLLNFRRIRRHTVQPPKAAQEARDFQPCEVHEYMELIYGGYTMEEVEKLIIQLTVFSEAGFHRLLEEVNKES